MLLNNNLFVDIKSLPDDVSKFILLSMTISNPKYTKLLKLGKCVDYIPEYLKIYQVSNDWLILPRGFYDTLIKEITKRGYSYELRDGRVKNKLKNQIKLNINLRSYQKTAINKAKKAYQGIIEAPSGSGKTVIGLALIAQLRQKALWLVHTKELAEQAVNKMVEFFGLKEEEIGYYGGGKWKDGERFCVGMVQTLINKEMDQDFLHQFGVVILDESHHAPASSFLELICQFPAYYRYGLTATPFRGDGLENIMFYHFGILIHKVEQKQLVKNGVLIIPKIRVVETDFYYNYIDDFPAMINAITEDEKRNNLILKYVLEEEEKGKHSLVLSERVEHCKKLNEKLKRIHPCVRSTVMVGSLNKSIREEIVNKINRGEYDVIFATGKLAEEGLDWKILDRLFLTCPSRSRGKVQQAIGRIQRPYTGKTDALVYDFVDSKVSLLISQYNSRFYEVYKGLKVFC